MDLKYGLPTVNSAWKMIRDAEKLNPGAWVNHSINVANAAKIISHHIDGMNPEIAFILGLLHDIGRRNGIHGIRHIKKKTC